MSISCGKCGAYNGFNHCSDPECPMKKLPIIAGPFPLGSEQPEVKPDEKDTQK